jgi:hypothetical protein
MTARQGKIVSIALIGLLSATVVLGVMVTVLKHRPLGELTSFVPGVFLILVFANLWGRYARLEAEHGPQFVATRGGGRTLLVVLALGLAIGGGLAAYLLARGG